MPVYCLFVRIAIADMSLYALYDVCLQKSKGSQLFGMLKNHSLDDGKSTLRKSKGKNVTFGPTKSMDERYLTKQPNTNGMLQHLPATAVVDLLGFYVYADCNDRPKLRPETYP